jgi:putative DNA primase/helicase
MRRAMARSEALKHLREANVESPSKIVDAALGSPTLTFHRADPFPLPVDGGNLLDALADTFRQFIVLAARVADALALWVLHTYCLAAAHISPIVVIESPTKRCGKTTLVILIDALAYRTISTSSITPAALFRVVDQYTPTLLIDEADTQLPKNEDLRAILNAGHTRTTAKVIRAVAVDGDYQPREFSVFGPKVVAAIGRLPDTVEDRALQIFLRRKTAKESVARLRQDRIVEETEILRSQAVRWAQDHLDALKIADPKIPDDLHDRARDNWRPLMAIADVAGGAWPMRAREAAKMLTVPNSTDEVSVMLLSDLRALFGKTNQPFLKTQDILTRLAKEDERPWGDWRDGKPLNSHQLGKLLRPFGVKSVQSHKPKNKVCRGYQRKDLADPFDRYLPPVVEPVSATSATSHGKKNLEPSGTAT